MKTQNLVTARASVALTKEAITDLKALAKKANLKMYDMMTALIDLATQDEEVFKRAAKLGTDACDLKQSTKEIFSQKVSKLPNDLQIRLKSLSIEELSALLQERKG